MTTAIWFVILRSDVVTTARGDGYDFVLHFFQLLAGDLEIQVEVENFPDCRLALLINNSYWDTQSSGTQKC